MKVVWRLPPKKTYQSHLTVPRHTTILATGVQKSTALQKAERLSMHLAQEAECSSNIKCCLMFRLGIDAATHLGSRYLVIGAMCAYFFAHTCFTRGKVTGNCSVTRRVTFAPTFIQHKAAASYGNCYLKAPHRR